MKRAAAFLSVFVLGLAVGAAGVLLVDMRTRATYREMLRMDLLQEQQMLAARTARQGDRLRSLVHRWNVVDASSDDGFRIFRASAALDDGFFDPFRLLGLKQMVIQADESHRGARRIEGLERGKLALALESIGSAGPADKQWRRAQNLLGSNLEQVRRITLSVVEIENSDTAKMAEAVVLDGQSPARQVEIRAPAEDVWRVAIKYFSGYNIPIENMDHSRFFLKTKAVDLGTTYAGMDSGKEVPIRNSWCDCSSGTLANGSSSETRIVLSFYVHLEGLAPSRTDVRIGTFYEDVKRANRTLYGSAYDIEMRSTCVSTGRLEREIADFLRKNAASASGQPQ